MEYLHGQAKAMQRPLAVLAAVAWLMFAFNTDQKLHPEFPELLYFRLGLTALGITVFIITFFDKIRGKGLGLLHVLFGYSLLTCSYFTGRIADDPNYVSGFQILIIISVFLPARLISIYRYYALSIIIFLSAVFVYEPDLYSYGARYSMSNLIISYVIGGMMGFILDRYRFDTFLNQHKIIQSNRALLYEIAERKRVEEALRESERLLAEIIDFLPDATFAIDRDGKVITWNRAIEEMTGVKAEYMLGKENYEYSIPFYGTPRPILIDLVFETEEEIEKKYRFIEKKGNILFSEADVPLNNQNRVLSAKASPLYDNNGNIVGAIESIRDITERKRMEEDIVQSNKMHQAILAASPVGIGRVKGRIMDWHNEAMDRLVLYEPHEMIGKDVLMLYPDDEEYERAGHAMYSNLAKLGYGQVETQWRRKDGTLIDCLIRISPIDSSDLGKDVIAVVVDITDLKRAEKALHESEKRYRSVIENIHDVYYCTDERGIMVMISPSILRMLGYDSIEEILGKPIESFWMHPEERADMLRRIKEDGAVRDYDVTIKKKDGSPLSVSVTSAFRVDDAGNILGVEGIIRDISERRRLEEARHRLEERLRRAEKMEVLGTLAGGVAHDLNNVLGVLIGYSELLLEKVPEENPLRKHAANILQSGQRGAAIIEDLLTLARRGVAISEVINLNVIVSGYFKAPEFDKLKEYHPHVTFKTDLEEDLLNIKGSPIHLGKTLMNLVSNAAEAISERGEITIRTENCYLDKPIQGYDDVQEGDYVVLTVSDNGKGISSKDLEHIFEPFFTKKVMGRSGTGLGLTVVWGTVKDHNGYIDVKSEEGKGTTFVLYFPVTREELIKDRKAIAPEKYIGRGESILVVDDVKEQRELAVAMLSKLGYKVTSVSSGEEAVSYIKTNKVDLLVLDMLMDPGIDGLDTYENILKINPEQKAIIVSGYSETERVKKAQDLGAGAYVKKPYVLEKIGLAVRRELDKE
ncbi:MAG TPA: PAS domain S-box protein [Syntrophales bacterium]|nr:PAS domain S-box protein [Syntrophales bacterium]